MAVRKKAKSRKKKKLTFNVFAKNRVFVSSFLLLSAVYLFIACFSYLFTWTLDQDKLMPFKLSLLWEGDLNLHNWLGRLGGILSHGLVYWGFGISSFILIGLLATISYRIYTKKGFKGFGKTIFYYFLLVSFLSVTLGFMFANYEFPWGGNFGTTVALWMSNFIGDIGLFLLLFFISVSYVFWLFNPSMEDLSFSKLKNLITDKDISLSQFTSGSKNSSKLQEEKVDESSVSEVEVDKDTEIKILEPVDEVVIDDSNDQNDEVHLEGKIKELELETDYDDSKEKSITEESEIEVVENPTSLANLSINEESQIDETPFDPTLDLSNYSFPELDLLNTYADQKRKVDRHELEEKKNEIIRTLANYKIEITKIMATVGPTVTLYEIVPAPGIRISKIKNLEDDIALSLSALGIRIIAPIPGKGTIGIEVPNKYKQVVSLREVLNSEKFQNTKMELPIALGKTISNEPFVADLAKMPHLLIAGATGQGKSVGINSIITSLLYKKHPSQLKLVMVDPKKVELFPYSRLENHFLAYLPDSDEPITTDVTKAVHTLNSLCIEMDQRYDLLKKARARNISEYNKKFVARRLNPNKGHKYMPYIVLVVDEFADLMMTAGKEVEHPIARLAQLSRAVGIHLIIATQRPSVNIITGIIKANFLARIAFKVTSKVDSRTILDTGGADQLIGRGDMLLSVNSEMVRIQGAFIDTPEVEDVIEFIHDQPSYPEPHFLPEYKGEDDDLDDDPLAISANDLDDYFEDAAKLIFSTQSGSTSMIQRKMKLGYNRAGRIMDQLEHFGIVGPANGSKPRKVLVFSEDELLSILENIREQQESI